MLSLPLTILIYTGVFKVTYIGAMQQMAIFLILGISADNMFVMFDAWQQSKLIGEFNGDLKKRMAFTVKRSFQALIITTSTTFFAFAVTYFSETIPLSSYGVFTAILIPVNFCLGMLMFPTMVLYHETHLINRCCCFKK